MQCFQSCGLIFARKAAILKVYTVEMFHGTEYSSVANPGFPRVKGAYPKGGRQPIIWPNFPENYMKMMKFWTRGGARVPRVPPLDPPL